MQLAWWPWEDWEVQQTPMSYEESKQDFDDAVNELLDILNPPEADDMVWG